MVADRGIMAGLEPLSSTAPDSAFPMNSPAPAEDQPRLPSHEPSHIVGVGASAGGLEALEQLFRSLPRESGAAFVVVQHLSPDFKSLMNELLARHTQMAIEKVEDGIRLQRNTIYLMPPKVEMIVSGGKLMLSAKDPQDGLALPIDKFFRSLAQDAGPKSIAVVLSGTGSDGSRGILDVHAAGGLVIAQSVESAKFDGMPRSAKDTGICDFCLSPEGIANAILEHVGLPTMVGKEHRGPVLPETAMEGICRLLQDAFGIDFTLYKTTTFTRRIDRRMLLEGVQSIDDYLALLGTSATELARLHADLLIGVTHFFRDTAAWELVEEEVIPDLLRNSEEDEEIRVWIAGCASGEEAYSMAILFLEVQQRLDIRRPVKIFATDAHQTSIDLAATGIFPSSSLADCSDERLRRYFVVNGDRFQVSPEVRKLIVFATHNVISDAPFTRLHLISCRNLLIYLLSDVQRRVISLFHFGLRTGGVLFLGPSETVAELADEVETIDEHWKLYRKRRDIRLPEAMRLTPPRINLAQRVERSRGVAVPTFRGDLLATYDSLLEEFMPCSLLVNERRELVQAFGNASRFLKMPDGRFSGDVAALMDADLRPTLIGLLHRAQKSDESLEIAGVRVKSDALEEFVTVTFRMIPKRGSGDQTWLVIFKQDASQVSIESLPTSVEAADLEQTNHLETELRYTRETLQAPIEELESSIEEVQASNDEMVASNEELQSTNEELNSVNEELYTVNAEHQKKINELTDVTNDMENLLRSTEIGTIFLDRDLMIRRFTPAAAAYANLMGHDIGRSIETFGHRFRHDGLIENIQDVLTLGGPIEIDTTHPDGRSFLLRILPYLAGTEIDGVVLAMIDVTRQQKVRRQFDRAAAELDELYRAAPVGLAMLGKDSRIRRVNGTLAEWIGHTVDDLTGTRIQDIDAAIANALAPHVSSVFETGTATDPVEVLVNLNGQQRFWIFRMYPGRIEDETRFVGIVVTDITQRKLAEDSLRQRTAELSQIYRTVPVGLANFDRNFNFIRINQYLADINGPTVDEHIGRHVRDVVPAIVDQVEPCLRQVFETGQPTELLEVTGTTPKAPSDERTWLAVYHPIMSDDKVISVGAVVTDITAMKVSETLLKQKTTELERSNKELEEFAYAASHDLQEPLRTISTYCEAINEDYADKLDENADRYLDFVIDATRRMKEQIQGLLEYSRIGRSNRNFTKVDCNEVLKDVTIDLSAKINGGAATLEVDQLPVVYGDYHLLHRLFQNLIVNSIKFSDKGNPPILRIAASESVTHWEFSVSDNGIGIDPAQADRIFHVFQRLHSASAYPGTGVGLALCKKIVELHSGTIRVESSGSDGSTFHFSISKAAR